MLIFAIVKFGFMEIKAVYWIVNHICVVLWCDNVALRPFPLASNSPVCLLPAPCQPCSDAEILLAVCTSDIGKPLLYSALESSNVF